MSPERTEQGMDAILEALALNARQARDLLNRARYLAEPDRWPHLGTVLREFGTWRAGIEAAGFTPRERGHHLNSERAAA